MNTTELRKAYVLALRERLEPLGFAYTNGDFSTKLDCGTGYVLPLIAATYGRLTTTLNIALIHDEFEELLWTVLADIGRELLPGYTILTNVSSFVRHQMLSVQMEVHADGDIQRVASLIATDVETVVMNAWASMTNLHAVCVSDHLLLERVPLALHLRDDEETGQLLDEWRVQDPRMQAIAASYRAHLPLVAAKRFT